MFNRRPCWLSHIALIHLFVHSVSPHHVPGAGLNGRDTGPRHHEADPLLGQMDTMTWRTNTCTHTCSWMCQHRCSWGLKGLPEMTDGFWKDRIIIHNKEAWDWEGNSENAAIFFRDRDKLNKLGVRLLQKRLRPTSVLQRGWVKSQRRASWVFFWRERGCGGWEAGGKELEAEAD